MESHLKPRKRDRIVSLFRRNDQSSTTSSKTPSVSPSPSISQAHIAIKESPDRQRAKARYLAAAEFLENAVKGREAKWGKFDFPELPGELANINNPQFGERIEKVLEHRKELVQDRSLWENFRRTAQCIFTALSPFATNFLTIAKEGESVISGEALF